MTDDGPVLLGDQWDVNVERKVVVVNDCDIGLQSQQLLC